MSDTASVTSTGSSRQSNYHEGYMQHKDSDCHAFRKYWVVLRGNVLLIFQSSNNRNSKHIGLLKLDEKTKVTCKPGKKSYGFEVRTATKLASNEFKCANENERDLWVAYIQGIATGSFPESDKLLPGQITSVCDAINDRKMDKPRSLRDAHSFTESGFGSVQTRSSGSGSGGGSGRESYWDQGGPVMNHIFYKKSPGQPTTNIVPSWFFANCTRQKAERILDMAFSYGNVLMRESVTFKDNGSYVLSLRRDTPSGKPEFEHFEVIRVMAGYKINVENEHSPLNCLQDVMDFFLQTAGPSYTRPFTSNNLDNLDINGPDYTPRIHAAGPPLLPPQGQARSSGFIPPPQIQPTAPYLTPDLEPARSSTQGCMQVGGEQPMYTNSVILTEEEVTQLLDEAILGSQQDVLYENQEDLQSHSQLEQSNYVNEDVVKQVSQAARSSRLSSVAQLEWGKNIRPDEPPPALAKPSAKQTSISFVDEPKSPPSMSPVNSLSSEIARKALEMTQRQRKKSESASRPAVPFPAPQGVPLIPPENRRLRPFSQQSGAPDLQKPTQSPSGACEAWSPTAEMPKTASRTAPQTKPKPDRRASSSELAQSVPSIREQPHPESGIVEEGHTSVRDALAMFDAAPRVRNDKTDRRSSTGMAQPPKTLATQAQPQPQASKSPHHPRSVSLTPATPEEPPPLDQVPTEELTREEFKHRLEKMIAGPPSTVPTSPRSPPPMFRPPAGSMSEEPPPLSRGKTGHSRDPNSPLPPRPCLGQDLLYSEPVN